MEVIPAKPGLLALPLLFLVSCAHTPKVQDGDIIFHRSQTKQAAAISMATHSQYTHMGVIFIEHGRPYVYEAVDPVSKTPMKRWVKRGLNEQYVIKRVKDPATLDTARLKQEIKPMMGRGYDWLFGWGNDRIYCSELVWKAYKQSCGIELGKGETLGKLDLSNPVVKALLKERYGKHVPYGMRVVSPQDIYDSPLLVSVAVGNPNADPPGASGSLVAKR